MAPTGAQWPAAGRPKARSSHEWPPLVSRPELGGEQVMIAPDNSLYWAREAPAGWLAGNWQCNGGHCKRLCRANCKRTQWSA